MKKGKDIAAEWEQIAPALHLPGEAPFRTPEGYFEALPSIVMQRIREAEATQAADAEVAGILSGLPKVNPFTPVSSAYFEQLSSQVMARIQQEENNITAPEVNSTTAIVEEELTALVEAREIDEILAGLPKAMPFTNAPAAYFEQLSGEVMARIQQQEARKVVKMPARKPLIKWAMAACMAGVVATAGLYFLNRPASALDTQLNNISDQELVDYLQTHTDDFDNDAVYASVSNLSSAAKDKDATTTSQVADVPTEEIQHYLETTDL